MSRGFISIGAGGPRFGIILGRRDVWAIIKLLVALAILGWALNFTSWAYDNPGDVAFSIGLGGAFAAIVWIACKIAGNAPLFRQAMVAVSAVEIDGVPVARPTSMMTIEALITLHNTIDVPPNVASGQAMMQHNPTGNHFVINTDGSMQLFHKSTGNYVKVDHSGNITANVTGGTQHYVGGDPALGHTMLPLMLSDGTPSPFAKGRKS